MSYRSFKICNNWKSFHTDIENIKSNLIKNAYPPFLINKVIKKYLDYKFSSNQNQLKDKSDIHYFKLPYISNLLHHIKNKLSHGSSPPLILGWGMDLKIPDQNNWGDLSKKINLGGAKSKWGPKI